MVVFRIFKPCTFQDKEPASKCNLNIYDLLQRDISGRYKKIIKYQITQVSILAICNCQGAVKALVTLTRDFSNDDNTFTIVYNIDIIQYRI